MITTSSQQGAQAQIVGPQFVGNLPGTPGNDVLQGGFGTYEIFGGSGDDLIVGTDDGDLLLGGLGADQIDGRPGNDFAFGGPDDDLMLGSDGDDVSVGGFGDDELRGQAGNDLLFGGDGQDVFVIQANNGRDVFADFQRGVDKIAVVPFSTADGSFMTVNDILGRLQASVDGSAFIPLLGGNFVTVLDVPPSALTANDIFIASA